MKIVCPEEIVWRVGYVDDTHLRQFAFEVNNVYAEYLKELQK